MLLKLPLARDARGQRAYLGALDGAAERRARPATSSWTSGDERRPLRAPAPGAVSPAARVTEDVAGEVIAECLTRALSSRPLLALDPAAQVAVREWVAAARPEIASHAWPLVATLKPELTGKVASLLSSAATLGPVSAAGAVPHHRRVREGRAPARPARPSVTRTYAPRVAGFAKPLAAAAAPRRPAARGPAPSPTAAGPSPA